MKLYQLYLITNNINQKRYVGQVIQTTGYLKRFQSHLYETQKGSNYYLHNAIRTYGAENFSVKLLMHNIPENQIDFYERLWIKKLNTYFRDNHGYNMTYGGQGTHGAPHSQESYERASLKWKQKWQEFKENNPEGYEQFCKQRSENLKGRHFSLSHRKHISEAAKQRVGEKNSFYGHKHSDKTKELISEANSKKVGMYDVSTNELIEVFSSLTEAGNFVISSGKTSNPNCIARISKICNGIDKTAYGYVWRFL